MFFLDPVDAILAFIFIPACIGVVFSLLFASIEALLTHKKWLYSFGRTLFTLITFYLFLILCIMIINELNWYV